MDKRKFKCTQCGKAFKYKHHLKEHLRIHSGEKPYECSNCKKRFSHSGSYSSHLSSKKCLSGGGPGNGSFFNGHTLPAHSFPSPTSPSTARSRNISKGKSSPYAPLTHYFTEQTANQGHADTLLASDLGRPWDAAAAIRMGVFQGTTLLPLLQSDGKFEALLQEMLRKEAGMEEQRGSRQEKHQANMTEGREGENDVSVVNVSCPWCFQLFPNEVVLKQHERYLCKAKSKEQQEVAQLHYHREGSPLKFLHVSKIPHVNRKMPTTPNGMSIELSSPQQVSWHSVPQQLLVPLQSPVHLRPDSSHGIWLNKQTGSPTDSSLMSPKSPSVQNHQHPGFSSPPCLDLSITLPSRPPQQRPSPRSGDSQNEPLDLSIPKLCTTSNTSKEAREQACNGSSLQRDRRDVERLNRKLTSPSQHHVGGAYPPLFGSAVLSSYPYFNPIIPNGLAAMGHNGVTPLPLTPPAPSPGFLSPMTYMMEAESETLLKRMQQERIAIGDARNHSSLDYLSLMEEGMDGDSGPGRKRLRKTEEGLYACDICDKSFQKSSSLLRHKYEHTGKRPHECQICKKAFKHKHHLIEHSRLHSGEKPYQCDKCGKRFSHSGSYSQHMNHRYAFCGQDQDPDGPVDEQVGGDMTLYTSSYRELNPETEDAPLTLEETATFFSNSILDRTPLGFNAENGNELESSASNHDRNKERRMDIEKSGDLEMATEEEKKEEEVEGQATKSNHHSNKIKAEQNGRTKEKRDSQAINLETV